MAKKSLGIKITPKQMAARWATLPHKFGLNVWNFEVRAATAAQDIFRESFNLKRFYSNGSVPWRERSPKSKETHPLMFESGSLKYSIKWRRIITHIGNQRVRIYTDPQGFRNAKRHSGFCYAAVHNAPTEAGTRTGRVANMPRRQFMGHSSVLDRKLKELSVMIFQGFPKNNDY